jgi:1-aminocyclopropane-1-carboxylate deaminase/D-cysteine desulfhydrase-like pyridoxal-dependent ACC family enzyme
LIDTFFELTPIQFIDNIYFKRDDLYVPFGEGTVNGGKLRQCMSLVSSNLKNKKIDCIISGSSIHSPQNAIVSGVGNYFNIPTYIFIGGNIDKNIKSNYLIKEVLKYNGILKESPSGRNSVLLSNIKKFAKLFKNSLIINYGIDLYDYYQDIILSISNQCSNLDKYYDNLAITCGSSITSIGVIFGLYLNNIQVKNLILIATAPNRIAKIKKTLIFLQNKLSNSFFIDKKFTSLVNYPFKYIDLFSTTGFLYEKRLENIQYGDIKFHPNYEAKTFT